MGYYLVTHSCGHNDYRMIRAGGPDYRDKRLAFEASRLCTACWKNQQDALWAEEAKQAAALNKNLGLPALVGTPRQIAWAETIRSKMADDLPPIAHSLRNSRYLRQKRFALLTPDTLNRVIDECITDYMTDPSAHFFITVHKNLERHFKKHFFSCLRTEAMKLSEDDKEHR